MAYVVLSFNLRNIYDSAKLDRDWATIAEIIKQERADIVCLQEIFSELPVRDLCRRLDMGFFSNWKYRMV